MWYMGVITHEEAQEEVEKRLGNIQKTDEKLIAYGHMRPLSREEKEKREQLLRKSLYTVVNTQYFITGPSSAAQFFKLAEEVV